MGSTYPEIEKTLFAGENNERQTAILPAVLLELSVQDYGNHANRCNLIEIPRSRYEQFGSTNQNNHSEEVFWVARTRKLKKRCSQERITKGKLQKS